MIDPEDDVPTTSSTTGASSGGGSASDTTHLLTGPNAAEWEAIRRTCRTHETQLYTKLTAYSKLAAQFARVQQSQPPTASTAAGGHSHSIQIKSERAEKQQSVFVRGDTRALTEQSTAVEKEIVALLTAFGEAVESMNKFVERGNSTATASGGGGAGAAAESTLQRYQSVLYDHTQDFKRTRENISSLSNRDQLLGDASRSLQTSARPKTDLALKEKSGLQSSLGLADDAIAQAATAQRGLERHRSMFSRISGTLENAASRFPQINALMTKIQRHKQRDTIILAGVIASCMCFTLFYIWNK